MQGKTELCGFRKWTGGAATIVLLLSPPVQLTGGCHLSCVKPFQLTAKTESALAW